MRREQTWSAKNLHRSPSSIPIHRAARLSYLLAALVWLKQADRVAEPQERRCAVDGCPNEPRPRLCGTHERHQGLYGDPTAGRFSPKTHPATCAVEGCDEPYRAKGLCKQHYERERDRIRGGAAAHGARRLRTSAVPVSVPVVGVSSGAGATARRSDPPLTYSVG